MLSIVTTKKCLKKESYKENEKRHLNKKIKIVNTKSHQVTLIFTTTKTAPFRLLIATLRLPPVFTFITFSGFIPGDGDKGQT